MVFKYINATDLAEISNMVSTLNAVSTFFFDGLKYRLEKEFTLLK